ncbi:Major facilitator superfamily multidrug transporter mdrA [Hyphodiscus hymeniophilus]|uniref:Major facilitator superfamily multidrug transporter mdrA n=1 Tax=Hyphodiscus hymeniophilus TaxID=353542 RepID=A0A9P6VE41_9HELO|nr:Major facilitator superfamily multidrug transporter mdrA [Hyphodiscus hymeniophilus]
MAAGEIDLPFQSELGRESEQTTMYEDEEKKSSNDGSVPIQYSSDALSDHSSISYHYLTFDTTLPHPSRQFPSDSSEQAAPPQPDLKKFTSPFLWSKSRKNFTVWLSSIATMITAYTAGSYSPATTQMSAEWHVGKVTILLGITTFCVGFAIAPMVLAPFSEINGRYPVFAVSGVLFFVCQICCAVTRSFPGMLVARFFVGCGSSVFSTMVGGVISDLYHAEDRNTPMAVYSGFVLVGTGLGPLVSGFISQNTTWRWVFWVQVITCGLVVGTVIVFFREPRGSVLLSRKAQCLNNWYEQREQLGYFGFEMPTGEPASEKKTQTQRVRWKVKSDEERESLSKMIGISVYRPFHLLITEPVVFFFSLWIAFSWGVLYLTFGSIPLVFGRSYDFTIQQAGAVFSSMIVGSIIATLLSIYQESLLTRYIQYFKGSAKTQSRLLRNLDVSSPEGRLYFVCLESALLPIGLFWFGWTQFPSIPWIVPTLAIGCATMGIYSIYLATFNYLADTYHRYASSALAAQSFCRNILGGIFPLVTAALFNNLTFQGASSLLGGIGAVLTIVPWVLVFYGPKIRARSKFAAEIM